MPSNPLVFTSHVQPIRLDHLVNPAAQGHIDLGDVLDAVLPRKDCGLVVDIPGIDEVEDDSQLLPVQVHKVAILHPAAQLKEVIDVQVPVRLPAFPGLPVAARIHT